MESWIKVTPESGTGNGNVAISANAHTGRLARSGTVKIENQNGTKPSKSIAVAQAQKDHFLSTTGTLPTSVPAAGGQLTITGKSNSKIIWALADGGGLDALNGGELTVNGVAQTNETGAFPQFTIAGDPGASAEFDFVFKINISPNNSAKTRSLTLYITGSPTTINTDKVKEVIFSISQPGSTSTLSVNKEAVSLVTAGTAQTVAVTSNDDWKVS